MYDLPETAILYASDSYGVYIPQNFAESINRESISGIDLADLDALALGPDDSTDEHWPSAESYWDIWGDVESNAILTDSEGNQFRLYQDGDLWLVPIDWQPTEEELL